MPKQTRAGGPAKRQMPQFRKPPPELVESFHEAVTPLPGVQQRQMFGSPAAFVRGQMFTGLFGPDWFVRLPDDGQAELQRAGGRAFEVMPGRAMKDYVVLPEAVRERPAELRRWLERSHEYASSLPPKKPR